MKISLQIHVFIQSILLLLIINSATAQYVTIGTTNTYGDSLPLSGGVSVNSWSYSIYKASELDTAAAINKLEVFHYNNYSANFNSIKVYLMHTSDTVFTNASYQSPDALGATLVYDGYFNLPTTQSSWYGVDFSSPFYYNGVDNLMVIWVDSNLYYAGNPTFKYHTTNRNCTKAASNTSMTPFPLSGSLTHSRPNTRFKVSAVANNDLSLESWNSISTYMATDTSVAFSFDIKNVTTTPQSNFTVKYSIDNGSTWKSKLITSTLAINSSMVVDFSTAGLTANMGTAGTYHCIAVVNNSSDANSTNDTIIKTVYVGGTNFSGTYIVGSSASADFPTLAVAAQLLNNGGMGGAVTLKIENGVYEGTVDFNNISGTGTASPLTIESMSGNPDDVIIRPMLSSYNNWLLRFNYMDSVKIRNISFTGDAASTISFGCLYLTHSKNVLFEGNKVIEESNTSTGAIYISYGGNRAITIKNNYIKCSAMGIKVNDGNHNIWIEGNKILGGNTYSNYAVYCYMSDSISLIANKLSSGLNVVNFYKVNGTASYKNKIINNFIYTNLGTYSGIMLDQSSYTDVDYNTVYLNGTNTNSANIVLNSSTNITLRNNNLINKAGGKLISGQYYSTFTSSSDYNNLYTTGSSLASGCSSNFAYFKSLYNQPHSVNNNVVFVNDSNLHLTSTNLWDIATPIAGIATDIDGQTRDAIPDIGADEHVFYADNGKVNKVNVVGCSGSGMYTEVEVKNIGSNSIQNLMLGWSLNGVVKPPVTWSGNAAFGDSIIVNLGNYLYSFNSIYNIKAWIMSVNYNLDPEPINDTIVKNNFHLHVPASVFQVGSSAAADYSNIDNVFNILETYGICGPIVINMENGTYNGSHIISNIEGLSNVNTLTIQPLNGDTSTVFFVHDATSNTGSYVFKMDSAKSVLFKNLSFRNNGNRTKEIEVYRSHNIHFQSCSFQSNTSALGGEENNHVIRYFESSGAIVDSCRIYNCYNGVLLKGSLGNLTKNNAITNNYIHVSGARGIYGNYVDTTYIQNNKVLSNLIGVYVYMAFNKLDISANTISLRSQSTLLGIGVYYFNGYNAPTTGNYQARIYNNFLDIKRTGVIGFNTEARGVKIYSSNKVNIDFNTMLFRDCVTGYAIDFDYSDSIKVRNNIIDADSIYLYKNYQQIAHFESDNNLFYSPISTPFYANGGLSYSTYKMVTGNDANSYFAQTIFLNPSDFHVYDSICNGKATPIAGITKDKDGDTRDAINPDIGADEFNLFDEDVELLAINTPNNPCAIGVQNVNISIKNMGKNVLVSDSLFFQLDGGFIHSYVWTGNLVKFDSATYINVGSLYLTAGSHTIKAWTTSPNNVTEINTLNDTLYKTFMVQAMPNIQLSTYALNGTVIFCNDSVIMPLTIKNTGNTDLIFSENHSATSWILNSNIVNDTLAPNDSITINYIFSGNQLYYGNYLENLQITTNDVGNPTVTISCVMMVKSLMKTNAVDLGPDTASCEAVQLDAGTYSYYAWNNSSHNNTIYAWVSGTYSVLVRNGNCQSMDTINVTVYPNPSTGISGLPSNSICDNQAAITLSGLPLGGTFTGLGAGNTFDPMSLGVGAYTVSYSYTNQYNCTDSIVLILNVYTGTSTSLLGLDTTYCLEGQIDTLFGIPSGGSFIGSGVSQNLFNPLQAGVGLHDVIYSYTNANGCVYKDSLSTEVLNPGVNITFTNYQASYCLGNDIDTLEALPLGGVFYGAGVNQDTLNPSIAGMGSHYLSYMVADSNQCNVMDSVMFRVYGNPVALMYPLNSLYCQNEGPVQLYGQPNGGYFEGSGVVVDKFYVENLPTGPYSVSYIYSDANGCGDTITRSTFLSNASINLGSDTTLCESQNLLLFMNSGFSNYQWSTGATGNFIVIDSTGTGIGDKIISLQVTDSLNCQGKDTISISFMDCTSLNDVDKTEFLISVYPNPSNGKFVLESNQSKLEMLKLKVLDISSRLIIDRKIYAKSGRFKEQIDLSAYPKGVYFIQLSNKETVKLIKLIVQ